jgi:hypothetical protein
MTMRSLYVPYYSYRRKRQYSGFAIVILAILVFILFDSQDKPEPVCPIHEFTGNEDECDEK